MRTYRGWLPGAVAERAAFVHPRADHSQHEQKIRAAKLDAIDADIQRRSREEIDRLEAVVLRINRLLSRMKDGPNRKASRKHLLARRKLARDEIGALRKQVGSSLPDAEQLPRYIERNGPGYRVSMSLRVYGTVYTQRSETHMTVAAASAAIGAVRRKLEKITKAARRQAEAERRTA